MHEASNEHNNREKCGENKCKPCLENCTICERVSIIRRVKSLDLWFSRKRSTELKTKQENRKGPRADQKCRFCFYHEDEPVPITNHKVSCKKVLCKCLPCEITRMRQIVSSSCPKK